MACSIAANTNWLVVEVLVLHDQDPPGECVDDEGDVNPRVQGSNPCGRTGRGSPAKPSNTAGEVDNHSAATSASRSVKGTSLHPANHALRSADSQNAA